VRGLVAVLAVGTVLLFRAGTTAGQPAPPPPGPGARRPAARRPSGAGRSLASRSKADEGRARRRPDAARRGAHPMKGMPARAHGSPAKAAHGGGHAVHVNWYRVPEGGEKNQPFLATLFNFIVLGLLLGRFGYPPIREFVKARHEKIGKDLSDAQRLRAEAEARLKEYEGKIANLDQEIAALLQQIRAEGGPNAPASSPPPRSRRSACAATPRPPSPRT